MAEWKTETCGTCEFFVGVCRRFPPSVTVEHGPLSENVRSYYVPAVAATPACGEWREEGGP